MSNIENLFARLQAAAAVVGTIPNDSRNTTEEICDSADSASLQPFKKDSVENGESIHEKVRAHSDFIPIKFVIGNHESGDPGALQATRRHGWTISWEWRHTRYSIFVLNKGPNRTQLTKPVSPLCVCVKT